MSLIVNQKPTDLAILWVGQESDTDSRVPTAEELAAAEALGRAHLSHSREKLRPAGLLNRPVFTVVGQQVQISALVVWAPKHPNLAQIPATQITLTSLPNQVINRYDYLYLVAFTVVVGAQQDPTVNLTFQWRNGTTLENITKENTRRLRTGYAYLSAQSPLTAAQLSTALDGQITISPLGTPLGSDRLFGLDISLTNGQTYELDGEPELIDLMRVWRIQKTLQAGWWWGEAKELPLESSIHLQPTYRYVGDGWQAWESRVEESFWRLMRGQSLSSAPRLNRAVYNLLNGQVGVNAAAPGIATISPNGANLLANGQRISFTNEAINSSLFAIPSATTNDGTGKAVASVSFGGNAPSGSQFSATGHKVYGATGIDISSSGTFAGGGGATALTWTATVIGTPAVGSTVYLVPRFSYPSGSGFPSCGTIEKVYFDGAALRPENVRQADLTAYTAPSGLDSHIAILQPSNAALRWIYKKYAVTADSGGVVRMPSVARGLIAWIDGNIAPTDRQNLPVIAGLTPDTAYNILCYHPPIAEEQWQFQFLVPTYPGTKDVAWLNGATVTTAPLCYAHTLGGGNISTLVPDALLADHVIAHRLPQNSSGAAIPAHSFNFAIQIKDGPFIGSVPFVAIPLPVSGAGLTALRPGQVLTATAIAGSYANSMSVALSASSAPIGIFKPQLQFNAGYQLVIVCDVVKSDEHRLLVITFNEGDPAIGNFLEASTGTGKFAAIDVFRYF